MLPGHAAKTIIGIFAGLAAIFGIMVIPDGPHQLLYIKIALVSGLLLYLWGSINYATGKGQSILWALVSLVPLGILVLVALPDRFEARKRQAFTKRFTPPPPNRLLLPLTLIAAAAIVGVGWYVCQRAGINLPTFLRWPGDRAADPAAVAEAKQRAMAAYPELGVLNSPLNREFVARYNRYQATNKDYFNDPNWPLTLAAESQAAINLSPAHR